MQPSYTSDTPNGWIIWDKLGLNNGLVFSEGQEDGLLWCVWITSALEPSDHVIAYTVAP